MSSPGKRARRAKARWRQELERHLHAANAAAGTTDERLWARWRALYAGCRTAHAIWIECMREAGQNTQDWRNF